MHQVPHVHKSMSLHRDLHNCAEPLVQFRFMYKKAAGRGIWQKRAHLPTLVYPHAGVGRAQIDTDSGVDLLLRFAILRCRTAEAAHSTKHCQVRGLAVHLQRCRFFSLSPLCFCNALPHSQTRSLQLGPRWRSETLKIPTSTKASQSLPFSIAFQLDELKSAWSTVTWGFAGTAAGIVGILYLLLVVVSDVNLCHILPTQYHVNGPWVGFKFLEIEDPFLVFF